jgi:hypothetical protein
VTNEEFQQIFLDFLQIEAERYEKTMAQASDILAKISAVSVSLDTMKANFDKAMLDMSAVLPGGHSAVMDTLTAPLDEMLAKISALGVEIEAKVKALPVPGAPPVA